MERYSYVVADVFTENPLQGNPVAVFLDARGISPERMQLIASEMHLSETVFVLPPSGDCDVRVRIFTPVNELPFAGHPTLGNDGGIMNTILYTIGYESKTLPQMISDLHAAGVEWS